MPGIRLRHQSLRNCVLVCPTDEWSANPHLCQMCNEVHPIRTLHLRLDHRGEVIVAPTIFRRLKRAGLGYFGLHIENEVKNPPGQTISLGGAPPRLFLVKHQRPQPPKTDPDPHQGAEGKPLERLTVPPERTVRPKKDYK